jgi:hypothetical protein
MGDFQERLRGAFFDCAIVLLTTRRPVMAQEPVGEPMSKAKAFSKTLGEIYPELRASTQIRLNESFKIKEMKRCTTIQ